MDIDELWAEKMWVKEELPHHLTKLNNYLLTHSIKKNSNNWNIC